MSRDIIPIMMTVQSFLRLAAIVTALLGLAIMVAPVPILTFFAEGQMPNDIHFVRFLGTALVGFGALNWAGSVITDLKGLLAVMYGNFVSLVLGILIDLFGLVLGRLNSRSGWILLLHLFFGVGFGYYIVKFRKHLVPHAKS